MHDPAPAVRRRSLLRFAGLGAVSAVVGSTLGGCGAETPRQPTASASPRTSATPSERPRVLLAYFSRAGWNYHYGGRKYLPTGNTEVLAGMISKLIGCDVHRIEAADSYSDDYHDTVERNVREQNANARPAIGNPLASIDQYDTVFLASGIRNVRAPMIMSTFADSYDFTGKTVHPVTTHAMSGLGTHRMRLRGLLSRRCRRRRARRPRRRSQRWRSRRRSLASAIRPARRMIMRQNGPVGADGPLLARRPPRGIRGFISARRVFELAVGQRSSAARVGRPAGIDPTTSGSV
ncbi:hypothetical protein NCC78_02095 [Micromonospora phytophila]|uniref:flavodoxin n=1 Tax=Micromonospora phytophila TaxID=709888 RepID=UPI0020306F7A|nr:flavodoxin [Micromonospora phytophila]MCM0673518.1 hypothetical protein [Micromonospora phytophila]